MKDLAYALASNVAATKYESLPEDVVEVTKKFILDTLATIVAGSSAPGCGGVVGQVKDWGGREESTILTYGGKVISPNAAFANSVMGHALDFDDTHDSATLHANVSVLPATLAMSELVGNISGKEMITAVAVGNDIMCRIGLGASGPINWVLSSTAGYFGATAAAGKILGFDESKLLHALGIAYSQCAGNAQCLIDGGLVKRMQPAFAARAAILSSLLAEKGITGATNIFEGKYGFFPLYYNNKYYRERIVTGLGKSFEGSNLSVKLYPCCRYTHGPIDATLSIVRANDFAPDDVEEVTVHVTPNAYDLVGKPFEVGESPQVDAQFSIAYTVSTAIIRKDVFIDDFFEEKIKKDEQRLQLTKKVKVIVDQEPIAKGLTPCAVRIRTKDGKEYYQHVEILRGDPRKPVGMEEIGQKFRKCATFSVKPLSPANIEQTIKVVSRLERIENLDEIIKLLV
jgi:2-methylcitrate dehydratase PrpD